LNVPLRVVAGKPDSDAIAHGFAQIDAENIIIETVKKAEEGDDIILRLYEANGASTKSTLTLSIKPEIIWKTDLLERPEEQLLIGTQNTLALTFQPFEILTLRLHLKK